MMRRVAGAALIVAVLLPAPRASAGDEGDLSYRSFIDSPRRIKCLYGYVADKTGDHASAIRIFEDCIERWNDVYSMIWLAQILESGIGAPRDEARAARLMERGAMVEGEGGYPTLARYHWGVALAEGRGVARDPARAREWLQRAAAEGDEQAARYLEQLPASD